MKFIVNYIVIKLESLHINFKFDEFLPTKGGFSICGSYFQL